MKSEILQLNPAETKKTENGLLNLMKTILDILLKFDKPVEVTFSDQKKKRSQDANSYCWVLCQKISRKTQSTKELVYQNAIKEVGQFVIVPIRNDAVDVYMRRWNCQGLGWHAEVFAEREDGYTNVITYFGSSSYDVHEMSILLNHILKRCHELQIETMSEEELNSLKGMINNAQ